VIDFSVSYAATSVAAPRRDRVGAGQGELGVLGQQLQYRPVQPGHVGGKPLELVGHRGQVGGLVVADRGPLAEPLLIWGGLGPQDPSLRVRVDRDDVAVGEDCHRRLVGVVDPHHDIAMTGQLLGGGGQQQRWEPALRLHQHRVARLLVG
jgi:hypothetical protein